MSMYMARGARVVSLFFPEPPLSFLLTTPHLTPIVPPSQVLCLSILNRLDAIDADRAVAFVRQCRNFDGGFGNVPGGESHAGQVFVCVGALALLGRLDEEVDRDSLSWWLSERQTKSGERRVGGRMGDARLPCLKHLLRGDTTPPSDKILGARMVHLALQSSARVIRS